MIQTLQNFYNSLKGWRTVIWGTVMTLPAFYLEFYDALKDAGVDLTPVAKSFHLEDKWPVYTVFCGVITIFFRIITKGPIGDNKPHIIPSPTTTETTPTS
jgi:hypothetical protein